MAEDDSSIKERSNTDTRVADNRDRRPEGGTSPADNNTRLQTGRGQMPGQADNSTRVQPRSRTASDVTSFTTRVPQGATGNAASGSLPGQGARQASSATTYTDIPGVSSQQKPRQPFSPGAGGSVSRRPPSANQQIILKNRFVLEETLGVGGMGVVYKAKDLRKVEAKDRNPYLAVKILSEDFRQHPHAFIALQREARKSQSIAHPNIVNVHDFDRDGETVFMTMEYMDGTPLDVYLQQYKGRGIALHTAMPIIKGMATALEYAHAQNITHADFKPGNIFVTHSGITKVFDFGIARAVATADKQAHHERTLFDPHTLGALTPAYASVEMLQGHPPTQQDDVFSLGCVVYEMLGGEHPYKRLQADDALAQKIKPKKIKGLSKQQWNALRKALAYKREDRARSVNEFLQDFTTTQKSGWLLPMVMLLLMAGGAAAYFQFWYQPHLSEEELKAKLENEFKAKFIKEKISELMTDATFTELWQVELWSQVQDGRKVLGKKDSWLLDIEERIVAQYVELAKARRQNQRYSEAQQLLKDAERYRGNGQLLENERIALDIAWEEYRAGRQQKADAEKQRLARLEQERQQRLAAQRAAADKARAQQPKPAPAPTKEEQEREARNVFALAMRNIKEQLRCKGDVNTRNLSGAVHKARSINNDKFKTEVPGIVTSLRECIEAIGREDANRALDLKAFALTLFPGDRMLNKIRIMPKDPCGKRMAGLGSRGKSGTCRDRLRDGGYGPRMVVIPAGSGLKPFAIGQFEVSVDDFNQYCKDSNECKPRSDVNPDLPVSNISYDELKGYVRWLSRNTSYTYRIPRRKEWLHAADASGSPLDDNRNCRIESRGITKGEKLDVVTAGKKNKWGLVNYVGNVQELVLANNRDLVAIGGAHTDPIGQCQLDSQRRHSGGRDKVTGFRLVRELRR